MKCTKKTTSNSPPTYAFKGLCNTTHPRHVRFQQGDVVVVRIVNIKMNNTMKRLAYATKLYRENALHYAVDIYVRASACVFSLGLSLNKDRTIRGQTPDQMVCLSCKTKYKASTYGQITEHDTGTVDQRIRLLKQKRAFVLQTALTTPHLKLLRHLTRHCSPHPSLPKLWLFQPTQPHLYKPFSTLHNRMYRRKPPRTAKQRKTYQCQSFALEFAHRPQKLMALFQ